MSTLQIYYHHFKIKKTLLSASVGHKNIKYSGIMPNKQEKIKEFEKCSGLSNTVAGLDSFHLCISVCLLYFSV